MFRWVANGFHRGLSKTSSWDRDYLVHFSIEMDSRRCSPVNILKAFSILVV
jgi:hypothetical protein